jgi:hypothetical protein
VALEYQRQGRLVQALAVCRSTLELAPDDFPTRVLLGEIEDARTGAAGEEPTRLAGDRSADAPLPGHGAATALGDAELDEDEQTNGSRDR